MILNEHPVDGVFYSKKEQGKISRALESRNLIVSGFQFCNILDGSSFDSLLWIRPLGGSLAEINPGISTFINIIDDTAYRIFRSILRQNKNSNENEVKRIACFLAAEGNSVKAHLTEARLLIQLDPVTYFKSVLPAIIPRSSSLKGDRQHFKIAYLLMLHDMHGYDQAVGLLKLLDDGEAIIMIHIDKRCESLSLLARLKEYLFIREKELVDRFPNVYFAERTFSNAWGHSSLIFTQLSGFWELIDMADWDFIINLSNYDYPLKNNSVIHDILSRDEYKDKNWIEYWEDTGLFT